METCRKDGCDRRLHAKDFCQRHYNQFRRTGSPDSYLDVPDEERFWNRVDKSGECWNWLGAKDGKGYSRISRDRYGHGYGHRYSLYLEIGELPPRVDVDHLCKNTSCVRPDHLRLATRAENLANRSKVGPSSKSGILNVSQSRAGTWRARVMKDGRQHQVGGFATPEEAEVAAVELRAKLGILSVTDGTLPAPADAPPASSSSTTKE